MSRLTLLCLLILLPLFAFGQAFTIYNYSVPEGMPSSEVYEVFEDSQGFVWFATDNGVARFDGQQMETFHLQDGLTDPVVFSFFEDYKKRLWFRTFSGKISFMENGTIKKYPFNHKLSDFNNKGIIDFVVNKKDELIFTSRHYFGKITTSGSTEIKEMVGEGVYYKSIGDDFVLGASARTLELRELIIDGKPFPVSTSHMSYLNRVFRAAKWKGKLYISLNTEVFQFDGNKVTKVVDAKKPVICIATDKDDNFWVGYMNGGAERFSSEDFSDPWRPEFLDSKSVTKVLHDHEGGLWFSTLENGVFHVPNLLIRHYRTATESRIKGVLGLGNKSLAGDQAGNIYEINAITKESRLATSLEGPVLSLCSKEESIWISTNAYIYNFTNDLKNKQATPGNAVDYTFGDDGDLFTFGGYRLRHFDAQNKLLSENIIEVPYRSVHRTDSAFFFADRVGLHVLDHQLKLQRVIEDFSEAKISNILGLNDTTLLITSVGKGFILMNPKNLKHKMFNTSTSFLADNIYSSLIDKNTVWLGTEKGLIKFDKNRLAKGDLSLQYLTRRSGLLSDKIDFLVKVDGAVWAFADNKFSVIPDNFSKFCSEEPIFYLKGIKVNERVIDNLSHISLKPSENNVSVAFGFISYNNPNIVLRYRLSENENWVYASSKNLFFSSLAPGSYSFELQYSADNRSWISALVPISFVINEPWWAEWYAISAGFILLIVFGYAYFRYQQSIYKQKNHYLHIINEHQQKLIQSEIVTLERERNRIAKELHDRVGTNLSAIKLSVNQLLQHYKEPLAGDVEEQFQIALREIKDIIYALTPPGLERYGLFTGLKNYIGKLNKNIPITISLKTFGKETSNNELNTLLFRVIQELLTNSIKHSFAKNVTIHISSFDDMLNIMYEDDGIGFVYDPLQSGLGLDSIESRINSINGTLKFESGKFGISYTIDIPINLNKEVA